MQVVEFSHSKAMANLALIEVVFSAQPRRVVPVSELPFFIGRGSENGNHLTMDDARISRKCVAITAASNGLQIEDLGQRGGIFVGGEQVAERRVLRDGERIRLGTDDGCQLVFRLPGGASSDKDAPTSLRK